MKNLRLSLKMISLIRPPGIPLRNHPKNNKSIGLLKLRAPNSKEKLIDNSKK